METFLVKALQLILSLSILVLVHEFGHFIFARIFKVRVEKFYLFFDPWFSIFKFKPKNSDTEYGVGWLPLGGYCKISGMIDESMDKEAMAQPPKPFHNVRFQDGDILLKADDTELERFGEDCFRRVLNAQTVTVLRGGVETVIPIPEDMAQRVMRDKKGFASYRFPMVVRELGKTESGESPAAVAGLQPGDSIVSINGIVTPSFYEVGEVLAQNKDKDVLVGFYRAGIPQTLTLHTDTAGKMGIYSVSPFDMYQTVTRKYGFFESFPAGVMLGVNTLKGYVSDMKYVFTKEGASSLGGFGTIGSLFPAEWDWHSFWMKTAFLSIILAFMNILPIPALDGGHVMFLLYEVIARRKPSDKFLEYAQVTGMFLLFALLIYANGNDIFRFFFK